MVRGDRQRFLRAAHVTGLVAAAVVTALTSHTSDWSDLLMISGLLAFAVISNSLTVTWRGVTMTGAFSALVLALVLCGPAPAVAIGFGSMLINALQRRMELRYALSSLFTWATFPLAGGLAFRTVAPAAEHEVAFSAAVLGLYTACMVMNFAGIWGYLVLADGRTWRAGIRDVFVHVLPVELATGLFVVAVVYVDRQIGSVSIALVTLIVLVFQYMARTANQAFERGEELEVRNEQLAALQVGLISTMLKTLSLRDHMTARHSAAVARYSRAMAEALELDADEVELIHTAALFHDIGKFIFPDSILLADRRLSDEEFMIVKRHPVVGADLISEIDGYGPVAEIVRHHHERMDGRGYPDGIDGDEIPLGSRIIAVADVYDVITARDTYRKPVSVQEAFAELRRSAGTQLDTELVELFIGLVESQGVMFRHSTAVDFEAELALDHRVRNYAAPRKVAA